jgi:hypothetical protein
MIWTMRSLLDLARIECEMGGGPRLLDQLVKEPFWVCWMMEKRCAPGIRQGNAYRESESMILSGQSLRSMRNRTSVHRILVVPPLEQGITEIIRPLTEHGPTVDQHHLVCPRHLHDAPGSDSPYETGELLRHALILRAEHLHHRAIIHYRRPAIRVKTSELAGILDLR